MTPQKHMAVGHWAASGVASSGDLQGLDFLSRLSGTLLFPLPQSPNSFLRAPSLFPV